MQSEYSHAGLLNFNKVLSHRPRVVFAISGIII